MSSSSLVLCSTPRLARALRAAHARAQCATGAARWDALQVLTLPQWLDAVLTQAMLAGEFPPERLPARQLTPLQEQLLWEQVIARAQETEAAQVLFDRRGLARAAMEAHRLELEWQVRVPEEEGSEETRHYRRWRADYLQLCRQHDALDAPQVLKCQIALLQRGAGTLPGVLYLAGFDRVSPLEQSLRDILQARGVELRTYGLGLSAPGIAQQLACDDAEAECRAAVAWVQQQLHRHPGARLAIVVPELSRLRRRLAALLDDVLHPAALHPAHAEMPRRYDFSLGQALSEVPLVRTALALLHMAVGRYRLAQADVGGLLRDAYWSSAVGEADSRCQLEARMRRKLPATLTLDALLRLVRNASDDGLAVVRLQQHLEALLQGCAALPARQTLAGWTEAFAALLESAGWPGERGLSSHEFQARRAWEEVLQQLSALGELQGKVGAADALRQLAHLCRERVFQPEAEQEAHIMVTGMLESPAAALDGVWVMGMNDHQWPPQARPNPLLPADAQRRAGAPNACVQGQAAFAEAIHRRWLFAAPQLVFSWARKEGERELRPSPLLAGLPQAAGQDAVATLAERLAQPAAMEWLEDHRAPPVAAGEKVAGGAGLLKAQAICPAWAYYRYRLGARALDAPVDGLDSLERGSLLHAVLQALWRDRDSAWLASLDAAALHAAVRDAVETGLCHFEQQREQPLPTQFAMLERRRLAALVQAWLVFERTRELAFTVQECERRIAVDVAGIAVELILDRVDALPDGRLVVLDYKTGSTVSHRSWADDRIAEPQLPIYAALALAGDAVAAVCFARVRADEQKFVGIAAESGLLPGVDGLDAARRLFPEARFAGWGELLEHWRRSLAAVAQEVHAGEAAVRFADPDALAGCEVLPLLRLPERKLQRERREAGA